MPNGEICLANRIVSVATQAGHWRFRGTVTIPLIDHHLFESVQLWVVFLEILFLFLLFSYSFEGHAHRFFPLFLEIQECVWVLKLIQISLNILVVVNVFLELCTPFTALLIVHEFLGIHVVKEDPDL